MVRPLALKALGAALGSQWEAEPGGLWMTDVLAGWWNQGLSSYLGHYIYIDFILNSIPQGGQVLALQTDELGHRSLPTPTDVRRPALEHPSSRPARAPSSFRLPSWHTAPMGSPTARGAEPSHPSLLRHCPQSALPPLLHPKMTHTQGSPWGCATDVEASLTLL